MDALSKIDSPVKKKSNAESCSGLYGLPSVPSPFVVFSKLQYKFPPNNAIVALLKVFFIVYIKDIKLTKVENILFLGVPLKNLNLYSKFCLIIKMEAEWLPFFN